MKISFGFDEFKSFLYWSRFGVLFFLLFFLLENVRGAAVAAPST